MQSCRLVIIFQKLELQTEMSKVKLEKVDLDTHLRAKLASVESQLMSLELSKAQEKTELEDQIVRIPHKYSFKYM